MNKNGTAADDTLVGTLGNDILNGLEGHDVLFGNAGDDTLDGGGGGDVLYGGEGADHYIIRDRNDYVYDSDGTDDGLIQVDFYKTTYTVEHWAWAPGMQKLPYWIDALLPDDAARYATLSGSEKTFYYCFATSVPAQLRPQDASGFKPFNEQQKVFARQAFAYISSVVGLKFVESPDAGGLNTIVLANNLQNGSSGYAWYPSSSPIGSDLLLNYSGTSARNLTPREGDYSALALIHELGHALGMKHPFQHVDSTGDQGPPPFLPAAEDSTQWTVMSYTSRPEDYYLRYSPLDLAALQYLYGPGASRLGNDTYALQSARSNFIWDGGGSDTIDGSGLSQAITLYLEPGYWGYVGDKASLISAAGQITVNFGSTIENANGGSAGDILSGNAAGNRLAGFNGNDTLTGKGGDDALDGGAGRDTAAFAGVRGNFALTKTATGYALADKTGAEGTDTLAGIERLRFSDTAVALDTDGDGGQAYRLYQAAFNRKPDVAGLGYWIAYLDKGASLYDAAAGFFNSAEFRNLYGSNPSDAELIDRFYDNVLHRAPEKEGKDWWLHELASGHQSRTMALVGFSESPENQARLIGVIENGMEYLPA